MKHLRQDMKRLSLFFLSGIVLAGLSLYGHRENPWNRLNSALRDPEAFDGRLIDLFVFPRIECLQPDGFQVSLRDGSVMKVHSDTAGLHPGDWINLKAWFHKDGTLTAQSVAIAKNQKYKIGFSLFPPILVVVLWFIVFRWNRASKQFEPRQNA